MGRPTKAAAAATAATLLVALLGTSATAARAQLPGTTDPDASMLQALEDLQILDVLPQEGSVRAGAGASDEAVPQDEQHQKYQAATAAAAAAPATAERLSPEMAAVAASFFGPGAPTEVVDWGPPPAPGSVPPLPETQADAAAAAGAAPATAANNWGAALPPGVLEAKRAASGVPSGIPQPLLNQNGGGPARFGTRVNSSVIPPNNASSRIPATATASYQASTLQDAFTGYSQAQEAKRKDDVKSCVGESLGPNGRLYPNQYLCSVSEDDGTLLRFGLNWMGMLIMYEDEKVVWSAKVRGDYLALQGEDAHLVLYGPGGVKKWSTNCFGRGKAQAASVNAAGMGGRGGFALVDENGNGVWLLPAQRGFPLGCYPGSPDSIAWPTSPPTPAPTSAPTAARLTGTPTRMPVVPVYVEPEEDEGGDPGDSWEAWAARDQVKVPHVVPAEEAAATPAPPTPWKKEPFDGLSSLTSVFPEVTANSTGITTFYMMGDSPFNDKEMTYWMPRQMANIQKNQAGVDFVFHAGNMQTPAASHCNPLWGQFVRDTILKTSPAPVFITPGTKDWADCKGKLGAPNSDDDAIQALDSWKETFLGLDKRWEHTLPVTYQGGYLENWAFLSKRTLFVSVHLINSPIIDELEWAQRHRASHAFIREAVDAYPGQFDVLVLLSNAKPTEHHDDFFNRLTYTIVTNRDLMRMPIVYLHGSGHIWEEEEKFLNLPNMLRVQIEGRKKHPVRVMIDTTSPNPVKIHRHQGDILAECCVRPGWPK